MTTVSTTRRRMMLRAAAAIVANAFATAAHAEPPVNTLRNSLFGGRTDTAINGYDPVAYFTVGKPVKGQDGFSFTWMDARWKFASQANLDLFKADPERYAPQYGGYCAYGVAKGNLVKVEPDQFTIRGGKLYLNYDADIQAQWLKDPDGFIAQANGKFKSLLKP
jgi:YHS domain